MIQYTLIRAFAVASVFLFIFFDKIWLAALPPLAVFVHYLLVRSQTAAGSLEFHADQVYFTAYLTTIAAFAAVLFRFLQHPAELLTDEAIPSLLRTTFIALATTVAGLLLMTDLKDRARHDEPKRQPGQQPTPEDVKVVLEYLNDTDIIQKLYCVMGQLSEVIGNMHETTSKTLNTIETLNTNLSNLQINVTVMTNHVDQTATSVNTFKEKVDGFKGNVDQLQQVMDRFATFLTNQIERAQGTAQGDGRD